MKFFSLNDRFQLIRVVIDLLAEAPKLLSRHLPHATTQERLIARLDLQVVVNFP
ncbi:hypothetical protein D3C87_2038650 [compost metagenome]